MANEVDMKKAKEVFDTLVNMLDSRGWKYEKHEEKLMIKSGIKGDDLPIEFHIAIKPGQQIVQFMSPLPGYMPEDKRVDGAIAVAAVNWKLNDGSFDYDLSDGQIVFRLTSSYRESTLGADLFEYMIMVSAGTIDEYNEKFVGLSLGLLTLEQFLEGAK